MLNNLCVQDNVLIDAGFHVRLADFGLANFGDAPTALHSSKRNGSGRWMAPELLKPEQYEIRFLRTPASDVYAFACTCLEVSVSVLCLPQCLISSVPHRYIPLSLRFLTSLGIKNGPQPSVLSTARGLFVPLQRRVVAGYCVMNFGLSLRDAGVKIFTLDPNRKA